jgi:outer membrane murein-binding lipoprotein Lpp
LVVLLAFHQARLVDLDSGTIEILVLIAVLWAVFAGLVTAIKIPLLGTFELGRKVAETSAKVAETTAKVDETTAKVDETQARVDATKEEVERTKARVDRLYAYAMNNNLFWHLKN